MNDVEARPAWIILAHLAGTLAQGDSADNRARSKSAIDAAASFAPIRPRLPISTQLAVGQETILESPAKILRRMQAIQPEE